MKIVLSKPIEFNGVSHNELDLELEKLTGNDLIEAEELLRSRGITTGAGDYSRNYLLAVASRALNIAPDALRGLNAKDFTRLINETLIFLAVSDSEAGAPADGSKK